MCCCPAGWVQRICDARSVLGQTHGAERLIGTLKLVIFCHCRHAKVSEMLARGWLVSHRTCRMPLSCRSMVEIYERDPRTSWMALFQQWDPIWLLSSLSSPSSEVTLPRILLSGVLPWLCQQIPQWKAGAQSQCWVLSWVKPGTAPGWIVPRG